MKEYTTIKIDTFTHKVLKDAKNLTGVPVSRIIEDLVKKAYPGAYDK